VIRARAENTLVTLDLGHRVIAWSEKTWEQARESARQLNNTTLLEWAPDGIRALVLVLKAAEGESDVEEALSAAREALEAAKRAGW
jgi:hypothetical protein